MDEPDMMRAVLLLALAACGPQLRRPALPLPVMAAPSIYDTSAAVAQAINDAASDEIIVLGARWPDTVWVRLVDERPEGGCGLFVASSRDIYIAPSCNYEGSEPATLVHELGHALGLEHSPDPSSIMYPTLRLGTPLPDAAKSLVEELRR